MSPIGPQGIEEGRIRWFDPTMYANLNSKVLPLAMASSIVASLLGLMYFIIFRRLWLVEDSLPAPRFQAFIKLTEIVSDLSSGALHRTRRSI